MSRLEDLIEELCPDGVEYKSLGDVCKFVKGSSLSKNDKGLGNIPIILYGELYTTYGNYITRILSATSIERISKKVTAEHGDLLLPISSTTKEAQIGKASAVCVNFPVYIGGDAIILKHEQNPGFLVHLLNSKWFEEKKMKCVFGTTIMHLRPNDLANISIPLPPLPVQEEIVRILDLFTVLEAELEAELEARKKQYEYYRDELMTFGDGVEWMTLGEIADFRNGKGHEKAIVADGKFIVINSKFISTDGAVKKHSQTQLSPLNIDDIVIVMSDLPNGRALAKCFIVDKDETYTLNQRIGALRVMDNEYIDTKFLYYILSRNKQLLKYDNGVDQTNLKKDQILNIGIPIPPIEEQKRIVAVLDRFDALVNDIAYGLPAEIEARRKQYEYYRDKLLSFEEASA